MKQKVTVLIEDYKIYSKLKQILFTERMSILPRTLEHLKRGKPPKPARPLHFDIEASAKGQLISTFKPVETA